MLVLEFVIRCVFTCNIYLLLHEFNSDIDAEVVYLSVFSQALFWCTLSVADRHLACTFAELTLYLNLAGFELKSAS